MAFFYIDEQDGYKLKMDRQSALLIPEFRELIERPKYGNNFFYYCILFCSRAPLGMKADEIKDQLAAEIVESMPYSSSEPTNVRGFYKNKNFIPVQARIRELYPDVLYDLYLSSTRKISELTFKRDKLDVGDVDNLMLMQEYNKMIDSLVKQVKSLEADMIKSLNNQTVTLGKGALQKELKK